jgi:hypothetical protein
MGMKQKKNLKEKNQNGRLKKTEIFKTANFLQNYRLVLGLVGLIDVKGIDVA